MGLNFLGDADEPSLFNQLGSLNSSIRAAQRTDFEGSFWQLAEIRNTQDSLAIATKPLLPSSPDSNVGYPVNNSAAIAITNLLDTFTYERIGVGLRVAAIAASTQIVVSIGWRFVYRGASFDHLVDVATLDSSQASATNIVVTRMSRQFTLFARRTGAGASNPTLNYAIQLL